MGRGNKRKVNKMGVQMRFHLRDLHSGSAPVNSFCFCFFLFLCWGVGRLHDQCSAPVSYSVRPSGQSMPLRMPGRRAFFHYTVLRTLLSKGEMLILYKEWGIPGHFQLAWRKEEQPQHKKRTLTPLSSILLLTLPSSSPPRLPQYGFYDLKLCILLDIIVFEWITMSQKWGWGEN